MEKKVFVICKTTDVPKEDHRKRNVRIVNNNVFFGVVGLHSAHPVVMVSRVQHEAIFHTSDELDSVLTLLYKKQYFKEEAPPQILEIKNRKVCI